MALSLVQKLSRERLGHPMHFYVFATHALNPNSFMTLRRKNGIKLPGRRIYQVLSIVTLLLSLYSFLKNENYFSHPEHWVLGLTLLWLATVYYRSGLSLLWPLPGERYYFRDDELVDNLALPKGIACIMLAGILISARQYLFEELNVMHPSLSLVLGFGCLLKGGLYIIEKVFPGPEWEVVITDTAVKVKEGITLVDSFEALDSFSLGEDRLDLALGVRKEWYMGELINPDDRPQLETRLVGFLREAKAKGKDTPASL